MSQPTFHRTRSAEGRNSFVRSDDPKNVRVEILTEKDGTKRELILRKAGSRWISVGCRILEE